jgi:hypothetical protein
LTALEDFIAFTCHKSFKSHMLILFSALYKSVIKPRTSSSVNALTIWPYAFWKRKINKISVIHFRFNKCHVKELLLLSLFSNKRPQEAYLGDYNGINQFVHRKKDSMRLVCVSVCTCALVCEHAHHHSFISFLSRDRSIASSKLSVFGERLSRKVVMCKPKMFLKWFQFKSRHLQRMSMLTLLFKK